MSSSSSPSSSNPPGAGSNVVGAAELFALERLSPSPSPSSTSPAVVSFRTIRGGIQIGNAANIAYGGCVLANSIHAAFWSLPGSQQAKDEWALYSTSGYYLGPARTDLKTEFEVTTIRSTRTFETRMVKAEQEIPAEKGKDASRRGVMIIFADFIKKGAANTLLKFSPDPRAKGITHHSKLKDFLPTVLERIQQGSIPTEIQGPLKKTFGGFQPFLEIRPCPQGVMEDNLYGLLPQVLDAQAVEPIQDRTSSSWFKAREEYGSGEKDSILLPPTRYAASILLASFYLDAAIAFTGLAHQGRTLFEAAACSSLDFSLRYHIDDVDVFDKWSLREIQTHVAEVERTYGETRMWQENEKGELFLAITMTQTGIMRGKKPREKL